ncbi:MAG TPA: glycosyltransferase family 25 protein [Chlamydiales bacterium]|nr:glycosyltransferase family 25 protein [Chlamydiales bacterium]
MKFKQILTYLCISTNFLHSAIIDLSPEEGIEHYFNKIINRPEIHSLDGIDYIYVINLDERPEKFQSTLDQLSPYGITPYRFSAVNGWKLPLSAFSYLGVKYSPEMTSNHMGTSYLIEDQGMPSHEMVHLPGKTYFCHCMSRGAVGIVLSHLSVLQDAWDNGYETIWVMEDDIEVKKDPRFLPEVIKKLDDLLGHDGWDILFTDQDTIGRDGKQVICTSFAWRPNFAPSNPYQFQYRQDISEDFRRLGARFGAYSMIVRRSGMKKILDFCKTYHIFMPYDMEFTQPPGIILINVRDEIVSTQARALSDNGAPNYEKSN